MTTRDKLIERAREAIASAHAFDSTFEDYAAAIVDALGLVECEGALESVSDYMREWDNPARDFAFRHNRRERMREKARAALSKLRGEQS